MKKFWKQAAALCMTAIVLVSLGACGPAAENTPATTTPPAASDTATPDATDKAEDNAPPALTYNYDKEITIDVYAGSANEQGIKGGWGAKIWKDMFNIKINVIAPNVSGQAIYQTRSAAGNLGDLIIFEQSKFRDAIQAGLIMEISDLLKVRGTDYQRFQKQIDITNENIGADGTYVLPIIISTNSPLEAIPNPAMGMRSHQDGAASYLRWDIYKEIGVPPVESLEDLLDVVQQMVDAEPASESGAKSYGFTIFKDWDGGSLHNIVHGFAQIYGWHLAPGTSTILTYGDTSALQTQRLDEEGGVHQRVLRFLNQAYRRGLLDPDSATQTWNNVATKMKDGQVMFGLWPWSTMTHYNNVDRGNAETPKGYMFVPIGDAKYYAKGFGPSSAGVAIGSKAQDPERLMDILNWLSTDEGAMINFDGPEGLAWEFGPDGLPRSTSFADEAAKDPEMLAPDEFGGGVYAQGAMQILTVFERMSIIESYGVTLDPRFWRDSVEKNNSKLNQDWRATMNAEHMIDYVKKNNMSVVAPGNLFIPPQASAESQSLRDMCGTIVKNASWQMIYANDDAEFDRIWEDMKSQIAASGWENIVNEDVEIAKGYAEACQEAIRNAQ